MFFSKLNSRTQIILIIQSIAMLAGTSTHLRWIFTNGFLSESYQAPLATKLFWDSLTFLDPLAAILLILKPKTGIWLTAAIIVVDVFHNGMVCLADLFENSLSVNRWAKENWMFMSQLGFGLFVVLSFKNNRREIYLKTNAAE